MDRMASHPYASIKTRIRKRAVVKYEFASPVPLTHICEPPRSEWDAPPSAEPSTGASQAKHQRLAEMLRDLRIGAEALCANADGLLSRLS